MEKNVEFDISVTKTGKDNNSIGTIISHKNDEETEPILHKLQKIADDKGINLIYDKKFLKEGNDFQRAIHQHFHGETAIVVLSKAAIESKWVNYEIGLLNSRGIKIYLLDKNGIMDAAKKDTSVSNDSDTEGARQEKNNYEHYYYIKQFLPAYKSEEDILAEINDYTLRHGLYENESQAMSAEQFREYCADKIATCQIKIVSTAFESYKKWFSQVRVGVLAVHFGQLDENPIKYSCQHSDCPLFGKKCAIKKIDKVSKENKNRECVLLNKVIYTGNILFEGDINPDTLIPDKNGEDYEKIQVGKSFLSVILPIHKEFGLKFKIIIDCPNQEVKDHILEALKDTPMNASASDTGGDMRIYCSLNPKDSYSSSDWRESKDLLELGDKYGLFVIHSPYEDNFLCPRILLEGEKKEST